MSSPVYLLLLLLTFLCPALYNCEMSPDEVAKLKASLELADNVASLAKDVRSVLESKGEKFEEGVGKLLTRLGKDSPQAKKNLGKALSVILKSMGMLAKIASTFGTMGPFISYILMFVPQEEPDNIKLMKKQFVEVNRKLDSITLQLASLRTEVQWSSYASVYSQDESRIENSWAKFMEFMESTLVAETKEEKMRLAERFTTFYDNTATEGSVASFYSYLTQDEPSLKINLLDILVEKFEGNITAVMQYSHHFTSVLTKGLQLNLYYYVLKGYNGEAKARESALKLGRVVQAQQSAVLSCTQNYQRWVKTDIETIGQKSTWERSRDLAVNIKAFLDEKYYWHDWVVMVYGKDESGHSLAGRYIEVPIQDLILVVFSRERGVEVDGDTKRQIQDHLNRLKQERMTVVATGIGRAHKCTATDLPDILKKETEANRRIVALHAGHLTDKYFRTPDAGYAEITCLTGGLAWDVEVTYTVFLEGRETYPPPCSSQNCGRGTCTVIEGTSGEFCRCEKDFYGDRCDSSVQDEVRWEKFKGGIGDRLPQPVPDLTSILSKITAVMEQLQDLQKRS